jgi:hypothetical protein
VCAQTQLEVGQLLEQSLLRGRERDAHIAQLDTQLDTQIHAHSLREEEAKKVVA